MLDLLSQLGVDHTFWVLLGIFTVCFLFMKAAFFGPMLRLIEARQGRTTHDRQEAERLTEEATVQAKQYQERLSDARIELRREVEGLVGEARTAEARAIAEARAKAKHIFQAAALKVDQERGRLYEALEPEVESVTAQVTEKLLMRG